MSFLAPFFLLGGLAVAVPFWLHRLHREDPERERFSSLMLLEPGSRRTLLRQRLRYLLLLALRAALLVALALTFAKPTWQRAPEAAADRDAEYHIIALDTSLSMNHAGHWNAAVAAANNLIDELPGGDPATLVAAGDPVRILAGPTLDRGELHAALRVLRPGAAAPDFGALLDSLAGLARDAGVAARLHLVSDLQQSALPTRFADLIPPADTELVLHPIATEASANWAIATVRHDRPGEHLAIELRGFATPDAERTVQVSINGEDLETRPVSIPASGRASIQLPLPSARLAQGFNRVRVAVRPDDALTIDDEHYVVIEHGTRGRLLILSADPEQRDAVYLVSAIEALGDASVELLVAPATTPLEEPLAAFDAVIALDAGALGTASTTALTAYARDGGAVLLAAGTQVAGQTRFPVTGQALATGFDRDALGQALGIGEADTSHPLLGAIDAWRSVRFHRYQPIEPAPGDQIPLRLDNGAPLLIETTLGNSDPPGKVLLFMSSLDTGWNDLPLSPAFVAFAGAIVDHLVHGSALPRVARPGDRLALRGGGQVLDPDGARVLGLAGTISGEDVRLERPGIYDVRRGGDAALVAVNPVLAESDLTPIDAATLARWREAAALPNRPGAARTAPMATRDAGFAPLWRWLLGLLALLALGETIVGHWHLKIRRELG